MNSTQEGAVDASSVSTGRMKKTRVHQQPPAPTKGTTKIPPRSYRGRQLTRSAAGDGFPRQKLSRPGVRANTCSVSQLNVSLAYRVRSRTRCLRQCKSERSLGIYSRVRPGHRRTQMAMMAGRPAVRENIWELSACMSSGFSEDVEPPPQFVADV